MTHHHGNPQHECQHEFIADEWQSGEDGKKVYVCIHCEVVLVGDADNDALPVEIPDWMELPL